MQQLMCVEQAIFNLATMARRAGNRSRATQLFKTLADSTSDSRLPAQLVLMQVRYSIMTAADHWVVDGHGAGDGRVVR